MIRSRFRFLAKFLFVLLRMHTPKLNMKRANKVLHCIRLPLTMSREQPKEITFVKDYFHCDYCGKLIVLSKAKSVKMLPGSLEFKRKKVWVLLKKAH